MDLGSAHGSIQIDYDGANVQRAIADMGTLEKAGGSLSKALDGAGKVLLGIGAAFAAPIGLAAKSAIDFGGEMANVNSILKLSDDQIAQLGDDVQNLSADVNKGPVELASALYDIASSGFTGAEGLDVLTAAANAANAGLTSTETAGRAISSVLNAYGLEASEAGHVSDVLFQIVNDGVLTFEQLANNMGNTLPLASSLGISIEELGAAYAQMTLQGVNASAAETQIASLMRAALNPTDALTEAVQAYGFESAEALINAEGFPGLLKAIDQGAGGSKEALFDMLGTQEAMNAALILADEDAAKYVDELGNMQSASDGAGATQEALEKQMKSAQFQMQRMGVASEALRVSFGETLEPAIASLSNAMGDLFFRLAELPEPVRQFATAFGSVVAVLGLGGGAALIAAGKIVELSNALAAAGVNVGKFALALGLVGLAIGAGILAYQTNFLGFADLVDSTINRVGKAVDTFGNVFQDTFSKRTAAGMRPLVAGIRSFGEALDAAFGTDISDEMHKVADAIDAIAEGFQFATENGFNPAAAVLHALAQGFDALGLDGVADALHTASDAAQDFGNTFASALRVAQEQRLSGVSATIDAFGNALSELIGIDVDGFFNKIADTLDVFTESMGKALSAGINPFEAALLGLRDAFSFLTGLDLESVFDGVGRALQIASRVLGEFIASLREGDIGGAFSGLADAIGDALGAIGDRLGPALQQLSTDAQTKIQEISDAIAASLSSIDLGEVLINIATFAQGKIADLTAKIKEWTGVDLAAGVDIGSVAVNILSFVAGKLADLKDAVLGFLGLGGGGSTQAAHSPLTSGDFSIDLPGIVVNIGNFIAGKIADLGAFLQTFLGIGGGRDPNAEVVTGAGLGDEGGITLQDVAVNIASWAQGIIAPIGDQLRGWIEEALNLAHVTIDNFTNWGLSLGMPGGGGNLGPTGHEASFGGGGGGLNDVFTNILTEAAIHVEKFTGWDLTVATPERGVEIDGDGIKSAIITALREAISVDASFVEEAGKLGAELGNALGSALADGINAAFSAITGGGGGGGIGPTGHEASFGADAFNFGDAFASFDQQFNAAFKAALAPEFEQIKAELKAWLDEQYAAISKGIFETAHPLSEGGLSDQISKNLMESMGIDPEKGLFGQFVEDFFSGFLPQDAEASELFKEGEVDPAAFGENFGQSLAEVFASPEFAEGMKSAIADIPAASFSGMGQAFLAKMQEGISQSLASEQRTPEELLRDDPVGPGMAENIVLGIVNSLTTALQSAEIPIELFTGIGTALMEKINAGIQSALSTGVDSLGGPGERGEAGTASGLGTSLVTALATSLAQAVTAAPPEAFAAVGTAIQAKLSQVLSTALSGGGGGRAPSPGLGAGGAPSGIGQAIAQMIASAVQSADFSAVASALSTAIVAPITTGMQEFSNALVVGINAAISAGQAAAATAGIIGSTLLTAARAGLGGLSAPPGGTGPIAPTTGGGGGLDTSVTAMVDTAVQAGVSAAAGASAIGAAIVSNAAAGVGGGSGGAVPSPGLGGGSAPGGTGGSLDGAVQSMVESAIQAGISAAAGASAIGAAVSQGAASGVILDAMNSAVATMVTNGIAAGMAAAEAASPSKKAARDLGEPVAQGAALGVQQAAPAFYDQITELMTTALDLGAQQLADGTGLWEQVARSLGIDTSGAIASGMEEGAGQITDAGKALTETITQMVNDRLASQAAARDTWLTTTEDVMGRHATWAQGLVDRGRDQQRIPDTIEAEFVTDGDGMGRIVMGHSLIPLLEGADRRGRRRFK